MTPAFPPLATLLPHAPPMLLLDRVLEHGEDWILVETTIAADHPFFDPAAGGVPCHVGIELMAQACGAFAGLGSLAEGRPPALGFLLGTRMFTSSVARFMAGDRLTVRVAKLYLDGEMGVFDCRINLGCALIASAQLTVYQPADPTAVLAGRVEG